MTEAELIAHARAGLAHYKCPTSVDFVDALPRTVTGKVQKFRLREPLLGRPRQASRVTLNRGDYREFENATTRVRAHATGEHLPRRR